MMRDGFYGPNNGSGLLFLLLIIVLLGVLAWLILASSHRHGPHGHGAYWDRSPGAGRGPGALSDEDPLRILAQRYARGEIDEEEFERRRKVLKG